MFTNSRLYKVNQLYAGSTEDADKNLFYLEREVNIMNTFGKKMLVFDTKLMYKFLKNWKASLGVDNITDELYHMGHPYPRRTFFAMLEASF
uniref:TonB-dependent receptor-like beta-barrel domain-containing protein n=1 Tax=uncultured Desulfobacterium sp. TaxID=201089 RepID=E1YMR7_9BACT|nr:unknown protein [uncultured Desulfobacterium sp.]